MIATLDTSQNWKQKTMNNMYWWTCWITFESISAKDNKHFQGHLICTKSNCYITHNQLGDFRDKDKMPVTCE